MITESLVVEVEIAAEELYLAARYCDSCERVGVDDDLKDKADREFIDARNNVESVLSDLLERCGVCAVVELHRIEVDGVE